MRLRVNHFLSFGLILALAACGGDSRPEQASVPLPSYGPAADYPVVVGDPFMIDGVVYTPSDKLNYDEVGYLRTEEEGGTSVSAAHRTLPLPSYAEVTSLETGRTVLVRVERRGPMSGDGLIALSPGAADQLGGTEGIPVRVRRVNPPEQERALLRKGERAPERMETPGSLLTVLKRKLSPPKPGPAPMAEQVEQPAIASVTGSEPLPVQEPVATPEVAQTPAPEVDPTPPTASPKPEAPVTSGFIVQAGAYSSQANAERAAKAIEGHVKDGKKFHLARTGPFATYQEAQASLAKVRAAGYSDARIFQTD